MSDADKRVLLIGYGNPGRLDDGLGPALAAAIEAKNLPGVDVDSDYQLTVEDAADIAKYDVVVFADADTSGPEPFWVRRIRAGNSEMNFSTHSVSPEAVLVLARDMFQSEPQAYLLGIRGYEFNEFGEWLCPQAERNLAEAVAYIEDALGKGEIAEIRNDGEG
jgi:hydrogenase maturation protease